MQSFKIDVNQKRRGHKDAFGYQLIKPIPVKLRSAVIANESFQLSKR
jgi:hypothetical protein